MNKLFKFFIASVVGFIAGIIVNTKMIDSSGLEIGLTSGVAGAALTLLVGAVLGLKGELFKRVADDPNKKTKNIPVLLALPVIVFIGLFLLGLLS